MSQSISNDPNLEWLGHVQPIGLVIAPRVLSELGLVPAIQTRADSEEVQSVILDDDTPPDHWAIAARLLDWQSTFVAGSPGGPAVPEELSILVPEAETYLAPDWAVAKPGGGWQILAQILSRGTDPDERGALSGWEATPHQRLERLLRETNIPIGLLISDDAWRLVYAPRGETSGWLRFPLVPLRDVAGRPMLAGLKLLLARFRLFSDAEPRRLPALLRESRNAQVAVSTTLASQVLGALHELLRGFNVADPARLADLARNKPSHVYEGLLAVLLRLVFLLYAEDRDLIPSRGDAAARGLYARGYGVRGLHTRLLDDQAKNPDTMNERTGAWGRLLALFKLVHSGDGTGWIRGRGGDLFDPAKFPFLQGQDTPDSPIAIPSLSDGAVLAVLNQLLMLKGERLSYRTLDVEQIGSVYETVMGFTVIQARGPSLAIAAGKYNRTPVFVDLAALAAKRGKDRIKALKDDYARGALTPKQSAAVEAARDEAALAEALRPLVDERGSPGSAIMPPDTPLLQPTDERRRTGSHYTPRSLTAPIVTYALEPAFARLGDAATPEQVLELKICDPAMGSGAFLVEACRQLATRLVAAWARRPGTRPPIPADEDEDLLARRLVAQRCLYGVDKNPRAVDLARLSLWLATLARDHEFTFLDHALKCGDSLVGLTNGQISALHWDLNGGMPLFATYVRQQVQAAVEDRREIREAPDDVARADQERRYRMVETKLNNIRTIGNAIIAAFFSANKAKAREAKRQEIESWANGPNDLMWVKLQGLEALLQHGDYPIHPFHWEIEFPEVFKRESAMFDAIVGNPPFLGGKSISTNLGDEFSYWLDTLHPGGTRSADLVAHFFRRAFGLLRHDGAFGLIATNTIGQGDTRTSGLTAILQNGGAILRATRRLKWPGEAAVVVSVVHVAKGEVPSPVLDGRQVRRISAYLVEGDLDTSPTALAANSGKAFVGSYVLGVGFTFDDSAAAKGAAETLDRMRELIENDQRNAERIFPFIGGEEVNTDPRHAHNRFVIDFFDRPLRRDVSMKRWTEMAEIEKARCRTTGVVPGDYPSEVAEDWPDLVEIVRRRVKPERDNQKRDALRERWWQFADKRPGLYSAIKPLNRVLVISQISAHHCFAMLPSHQVFAHRLNVFALSSGSAFAALQSSVHEMWARSFGYTLEDRNGYSPEDNFRNFPLPEHFDYNTTLESAGEAYHSFRAKLMIARNEGLTKTYNRFHDRGETAPDIARLRALHATMDEAVLRAYGWGDLASRAAPEFIEQDADEGKTPKTRLDWPAEFKDEVLARLLALNAERAAAERAAGLMPIDSEDGESDADGNE